MKTVLAVVVIGLAACGGVATDAKNGDAAQETAPVNASGLYTLTMSSPIATSFTAFSGTLLVSQADGGKLTALASIQNPNLPDPSFSQQTVIFSGSVAADGTLALTSEGGGIDMQGTRSVDGSLRGGCVGLYSGAVWSAAPR